MINTNQRDIWGLDYNIIATKLSRYIANKEYPKHVQFDHPKIEQPLSIEYTFDQELQYFIQAKLNKYNPDYGIVVVINSDNGKILAMADSSRDKLNHGNLAIRGNYPAASISKIITASAAINEGIANPSTILSFNGKETSLYKKQVFQHRNNRWTNHYSLSKSFAKSVNSVFARLGAVDVGGPLLLSYATRLGFNGRFTSDFMFENGTIDINPNNRWQVAEMASGYTINNRLSPLHSAALAATIANGGELVAPMLVNAITDPNGIPLYLYEAPAKTRVISEKTAHQMQQLMRAVTQIGPTKKAFRRFKHDKLGDIDIGGKTGSLTGYNPNGKYE